MERIWSVRRARVRGPPRPVGAASPHPRARAFVLWEQQPLSPSVRMRGVCLSVPMPLCIVGCGWGGDNFYMQGRAAPRGRLCRRPRLRPAPPRESRRVCLQPGRGALPAAAGREAVLLLFPWAGLGLTSCDRRYDKRQCSASPQMLFIVSLLRELGRWCAPVPGLCFHRSEGQTTRTDCGSSHFCAQGLLNLAITDNNTFLDVLLPFFIIFNL